MKRRSLSSRALLVLSASSMARVGSMAAVPTPAAGETVTVTVTAVAKKNATPPPIKKEDVQVFQGKERMQVVDWTRGESLFLAILIDDSLSSEVANHWNDLKAFINAQQPSTYIAVAYTRNGTPTVALHFTTNHPLPLKAYPFPP